jgi:hypothetical protein
MQCSPLMRNLWWDGLLIVWYIETIVFRDEIPLTEQMIKLNETWNCFDMVKNSVTDGDHNVSISVSDT